MTEAIYWAKLTDLSVAIMALPNLDTSLMILERLPLTWLDPMACQHGLRFEPFNRAESFNQWERGRIFNAQAEFRWEKIGHTFHAIYIGADIQPLSEFQRDNTLDLSNSESKYYFLWGERLSAKKLKAIEQDENDHLYLELQIGRLLRYPVTKKGERVQLQIKEYVDSNTQARLYYRFQGVKAV